MTSKKSRRRGRFIVLEGIDGSGTTTQLKYAAEWLERHAPEHRRIVHDEMDVLVIEIASWFARISAPVAAR